MHNIINSVRCQIIKPTNALFFTTFIVAFCPLTLHVFQNLTVPSPGVTICY
jgi:hypothetical protein